MPGKLMTGMLTGLAVTLVTASPEAGLFIGLAVPLFAWVWERVPPP